MKKIVSIILAAALMMGLLSACHSEPAKKTLNPADYETNQQILTVADEKDRAF